MHEEPVGMEREISDGGKDVAGDEFGDKAGDIGQHEGDPAGSYNALTLVLFGFNFLGYNVEIMGMTGEDRGDVHLRFSADGLLDGQVVG